MMENQQKPIEITTIICEEITLVGRFTKEQADDLLSKKEVWEERMKEDLNEMMGGNADDIHVDIHNFVMDLEELERSKAEVTDSDGRS